MSESTFLRSGERRNVSIIFSDMKGFTALSERLDPEVMDALMDQIFGAYTEIIEGHGGRVEKYIGDALVAVFGVPSIQEDDPTRAVNSALDFLDRVGELRANWAAEGVDISFRTGVHTGLITTGKRGDYEVVTGHAMSVASRLESAAAPNSILVSQETRDRCESDFVFSEPKRLEIRGRQEPLVAYEILRRSNDPFHERSEFVGRKDSIENLTKAYLRHDTRLTGGRLLLGDAGIGKTRLAAGFIRNVQSFPGFRSAVLHARAQRYRTEQFSVLTDMLCNYLGVSRGAEEMDIVGALQGRADIERSSAEGFAAIVKSRRDSPVENQAFVIIYRILTSIIEQHKESPYAAIVFIDNLFFIDRQSRDFFEFFLKNAEVKPFFLLADRSEHPDILEVFRGVEVVHVPPLDREEATRLLRSVCPECSEEGLEESILENAGGNPLFIREFARFARESQEGSTLPSTIQNIFLTSVDSYSEDMRDLLKKLSVFRVNFTAEDIRYLQSRTDGDPAAVEEALAFYVREGLLIRDHEVYSFKHDVLKKALYGSILNFNKRILHRIIADRMEQTPDPHEIRLLDHLIRAEEFERAEQALSHARNLMVNLDYLPFIDTLLDRLSEDDFARMNELLFAKTALLFNNGNTDEADKVLHKILRIGVSKQAPDYIAMAYHVITAYNLQSYAFHKAMHCGQKALSYYRALGKSLGNQRNVLRLLCLSETLGGHTEESAWLLEEIRALTDPEKPEERYELSLTAAERSAILSDYRAVSGYLRTIEEEELDPGEDYLRARRIYLSIQNSWSRCDFPRLLRAFENPELGLERQHSNLSQAHAMRATALHFEGRSERARESLQQAEFFFFQIRNEHDRCDAARTLALCAASIGQTDRARQAALDALSPGLRLSAFYPSLSLLMLLVEQAELAGELEEARFFLYEASHYMPPGPAVARRDRISYHFFNDLLGGVDDTDLQTHVELARDLLREELTQIENTEAFLAQRSYRRIRERLMGVGQAP